MAVFKKYQHVERLGATEVDGILDGTCHIFTKLDGANGSVWLDKTNRIRCGSRNTELSETVTNRGFMQWVLQNEHKFKELFVRYPNVCRVYGEWLVEHQIKYYTAYNKFYVFDVLHTDTNYIAYEDYKALLDQCEIEYVPLIKQLKNPQLNQLKAIALNENRFLIDENDSHMGEGIVIKNYNFKNKFKRTCWAKLITSEIAEIEGKNIEKETKINKSVEDTIVDKYISDHFIDKMLDLIGTDESKQNHELKDLIFSEFLNEDARDFLLTFEFSKIQVSKLRTKVNAKVDKRLNSLK